MRQETVLSDETQRVRAHLTGNRYKVSSVRGEGLCEPMVGTAWYPWWSGQYVVRSCVDSYSVLG